MQISDEGVRLIKSFEGYHKRLDDGRCLAYRCPANVLTIGYGCTEGVKEGMIWTEAEAEAALMRELAKHEAAVNRLVTVDINQNEFDALVSLSYNIGTGAFGRSTLLKRLNKGDREGAFKQFQKWKYGGGRVLRGLESRRTREAALFAKPVAKPDEPYMPQTVAKDPETSTKVVVGTGVGVGGGVITGAIPVPPNIDPVTGWTAHGDKIVAVGSWVKLNPWVALMCVAWAAAMYFVPRYWPKVMGMFSWRSS